MPDTLHSRALAAVEEGRPAEALELLRESVGAELDVEQLNDLAVVLDLAGRADEARAALRTALVLDPDRTDAQENLALLEAREAGTPAAWRRSETIGGPDPAMFERAFPGMPKPDTMSEHAARYAFALGLVGGRHVLDCGCGTGYGSEMLTWTARSVRGFDLWEPGDHERPTWPGAPALHYGHDLCADPLPQADVAVMFEVIEHLPDAPAALRIAWEAVGTIIASFPNPVHHGSWMNQFHVNDWPLEQFERELETAAGRSLTLDHFHQPLGSTLLTPGRDPESSFWVVVAR